MRRNGGDQPLSDINITPLTDVVLVLLIIFMISSPILLARGMGVHLPKVTEPPMLKPEDHVLYLTADRKINLDNTDYTAEQLPDAFKTLVEAADLKQEPVNLFIHAEESVTYGEITGLMDMATTAGIEQISLVQDIRPPTPPAGTPLPQPEAGETQPAAEIEPLSAGE